MAAKPKPETKQTEASGPKPQTFPLLKNKDSLGAWLVKPETRHGVIYYNADFVAINDGYPKSSVHTLLLPRSPSHNLQHPFDAFKDETFLSRVKDEVEKLKVLVAKELQRRFAAGSAAEVRREALLNGELEPEGADDQLPSGRDWAAEVITGIHAHPSMNHLHVHVLSREMHSPCVKHRKHYNSFNTPFLIDVADFPLADGDPRLHPGRAGYLNRDLKCWRCGKNFGNHFKALKDHLDEEFLEWKKE
jgi:aprataxin